MRFKNLVLIAASSLAVVPHAAVAAGSIEFYEVRRNGASLAVTGSATFVQQPNVPLGTDPLDDAPTGIKQLGGDLTSIGMYTTPTGDVIGRIGFENVMMAYSTPAITFGWAFCVDGTSCYELQTQRVTVGSTTVFPHLPLSVLYRCATPACEASGLTHVQTGGITGYFSPYFYTVTLPAAVEATPGSTITGAQGGSAVFSALGTAEPMTLQRGTGDALGTMGSYTVPAKEVAVALSPAQDPATVEYGDPVTPDVDGIWGTTVDVSERKGPHTVHARSCLGAGNCAYATYDITL